MLCCPACLELSDGLHRRSAQAYLEILLGSPAPSDGALFPQRPKLVCFKEVIFRSCSLAGGKTFFLNRRVDCNRIPLFPVSFAFFYRILSLFLCHSVPLPLLPSSPCLPFPSSLSLSVSLLPLCKELVQGSLQRVREGPSLCFKNVVL